MLVIRFIFSYLFHVYFCPCSSFIFRLLYLLTIICISCSFQLFFSYICSYISVYICAYAILSFYASTYPYLYPQVYAQAFLILFILFFNAMFKLISLFHACAQVCFILSFYAYSNFMFIIYIYIYNYACHMLMPSIIYPCLSSDYLFLVLYLCLCHSHHLGLCLYFFY